MSKTVLRVLLGIVLLIAVGAAIAYRDRLDPAALQAWVESAGAAGPAAFVALYALAAILFLPGSVLTLAGGALFGPVWGTLWNLAGATLGASLAFLIARYLGADWVSRRAGPRLARLNEGVSSEGWRFIAFVRLVPVFPFNLLNYALGLTRIPFPAYAIASCIFMLPGSIAYTWLGHAGREALSGGEGMIRNITIALALLAVVAFLPRLVRKLREKPMLAVEVLKRQLDAGEDVLMLDVRAAAEYNGEMGHIAGALNVPLEQLTSRLAELEAYKARPIRILCGTDSCSAKAARLLGEAGFSDAQGIQGGMVAWRAKGWLVENAK